MHDVLAICNRVVVLYEGTKVAELDREGLTVEEIVRYIVTDPDARGADQPPSTAAIE
jgi:ABC-type sugar transport system ATPase subunit